jgi:hypothetical protein
LSDVYCFYDEDEELFVCVDDEEFMAGLIPVVTGTPANGYVAEDGVTFYVAEDGATFYVQEI